MRVDEQGYVSENKARVDFCCGTLIAKIFQQDTGRFNVTKRFLLTLRA